MLMELLSPVIIILGLLNVAYAWNQPFSRRQHSASLRLTSSNQHSHVFNKSVRSKAERDLGMVVPSVHEIRAAFPALQGHRDWAFFENAGGSQVPAGVIDAVPSYFRDAYVQLGAGYELADKADELVKQAHDLEELLMNAGTEGRVAIGPSTSVLVESLATSFVLGKQLCSTDEVIVSQAAHEANKGPWVRAAEAVGAAVRVWPCRIDHDNAETCPIDTLLPLLGDKVVCVDGVAYAPHAAMDVRGWDVDFYVYSHYKVFGPHQASLYLRLSATQGLVGPNHFFVAADAIPYKLELGGTAHELCAGRLALKQYLSFLAGVDHLSVAVDRETVEKAFRRVQELESPITERIHSFLASVPGVRVYTAKGKPRVPTVSFTHESIRNQDIVAALHAAKIACRHGHMYSYDLVEALGLDPNDGVVRFSCLHYNTLEEVDRMIKALQKVFAAQEGS